LLVVPSGKIHSGGKFSPFMILLDLSKIVYLTISLSVIFSLSKNTDYKAVAPVPNLNFKIKV